jgi:hypothetical protein
MTEGNYMQNILFRRKRRKKDLHIYREFIEKKVSPMVVMMEVVVDMFSCGIRTLDFVSS